MGKGPTRWLGRPYDGRCAGRGMMMKVLGFVARVVGKRGAR